MLQFYTRIGRPLYRFRLLLWLLAAIAAGIFVSGMFRSADSQSYLLASFVLSLWAVLLIAVGHSFCEPPPIVDRNDRLMTRLATRVKRGMLWLLAILTTGIFAFVGFLSIRAVGLLLDTGHMTFAGGDAVAVAARHGPRINHVHCKDVRGSVLGKRQLAPRAPMGCFGSFGWAG